MISPPHRILFATDFSGRCDRPLERSLRLASRWQSTLILLHVLDAKDRKLTDEERHSEEARISEKLRAEAKDSQVAIETIIATGPVAPTIADKAEELDAELIVTGVARYDELGDFLLGTTVDRLIRRTHVPVLVVKQRATSDYSTLLVATDFSDCSATALEVAAGFFPDSALNLAHAYQVSFDSIRSRDAHAPALQAQIAIQLAEFLDHVHIAPEARERLDFHLDYGDTVPVIGGLVRSTATDLAVIGTHGRSGFVAATIGSDAKALLESLTCDVLMVHDEVH